MIVNCGLKSFEFSMPLDMFRLPLSLLGVSNLILLVGEFVVNVDLRVGWLGVLVCDNDDVALVVDDCVDVDFCGEGVVV